MRQLKELVSALPPEAAGTLLDELHIYDGDTTRQLDQAQKEAIRYKSRIIFTTPDTVRRDESMQRALDLEFSFFFSFFIHSNSTRRGNTNSTGPVLYRRCMPT
jgi:hypothetical protein